MAQLKSTSVIGNLSVTDKIVASEIIKTGGTASQLLLANGSVTTMADLLADTYPKFIQTKKMGEENWYGKSWPIYAQWETNNVCKWKVDGYSTKVDEATKATQDGDGHTITSKYVTLAGNKTITGTTTFDGPISTTAKCLGNNGTNLDYLMGITSYDSGGYMKWQSAADFISQKGLATQSWTNGQLTANYYPLTGGYINGPIGSKDLFLSKPVADYRTKASSVTGAITITLPADIGDTMTSMWIDVYNYVTNTSFSAHVGGYTYTDQYGNRSWQYNPFAMVYGANHTVRLGYNGSNYVVYIGELDSTWAYPQISVRDVLIGYSQNAGKWITDWSIGFTTDSFKGLVGTATTITNYAWTTKNFNPGNYLPLTGGRLTGDLEITHNDAALITRMGDSWWTGIKSRTAGDEAVCFDAINPRTSWMFRTYDPRTNTNDWRVGVPSLHIKRQRVAINKLIADGADAAHYLDVNGDVGATAYVLSDKATIQYNTADDCIEYVFA